MPYSDFGIRARAQMLRKGVSCVKIAHALGISNAYLSDILKGARDGKKYKVKIAALLGINERL